MSPQTFVMSSLTRNSAQTFSYFIPPNSVGDHHSSLSHCCRTTLMADYIIPVLIQQQNCREEENLVFCFGAQFNSTLNLTQSG